MKSSGSGANALRRGSEGSGSDGGWAHAWDIVRRAFDEFLGLPSCIIAGFLLLAATTFWLDRARPLWLEPLRQVLEGFLSNSKATASLLSTIAGSLITVTSITISLLLVAVQQSAGTMTSQVFDQFLRRRHNQFHFGFFVGLSVFALVTLGSVDEGFNPVLGASVTFVLTVIALFLLIVLLYATIDQMRPVKIIETIHDYALRARPRLLSLQRHTVAASRGSRGRPQSVSAERHGFVTDIDVDRLRACLGPDAAGVEIVLCVSIGSYVAYGDVLARFDGADAEQADVLGSSIVRAVRLERQRNIVVDPAYAIAQLETIAWTSISSSKSDPAPGILTIESLRDLLARWSAEEREPHQRAESGVAIVYADTTLPRLMDAFETLAVAASESMQHQSLVAVLVALSTLFDRLPPDLARRAEDVVLRVLSSLGDHVCTAPLDNALGSLVTAFREAGREVTAAAVERARRQLELTIGRLGSRSTRGDTRA
jgi:uncharacterized membrane protein